MFRVFSDLVSLFREVKSFQADSERRKLSEEMRKELWEYQRSMMLAIEKSLIVSQPYGTQTQRPHADDSSGMRSLLDVRQTHFSEEKQFLCSQLADEIAYRAVKKRERLVLLLDAGSTILPLFRLLCEHPMIAESADKCGNITIVTNNLGGVSSLLRYGTVGTAINARTRFDCFVPQGKVNSTYEAVLGDNTASDMSDIVEGLGGGGDDYEGDQPRTIAIVTGNYVSVKDGLLARGREHIEVKRKMIELADESYAVAPLGKILPCTKKHLNDALKSQDENQYKEYEAVEYGDSCPKPKLVFTVRPADEYGMKPTSVIKDYFVGLGRYIASVADACAFTIDPKYRSTVDPFDLSVAMRVTRQLMDEDKAIWDYEFPHLPMRELMHDALSKREPSDPVSVLIEKYCVKNQ